MCIRDRRKEEEEEEEEERAPLAIAYPRLGPLRARVRRASQAHVEVAQGAVGGGKEADRAVGRT
eukprot:500736-Pyramimonas_sp.AAC.1